MADVSSSGRPNTGADRRPGTAPAADAGPAYGSRREARERALSLLYEADAKDISPAALLAEIPVEPAPYVTSVVAGVGRRRVEIDKLIDRFAIDWTIDRMPVIDRTVVRMATFELLYRPDVPTGVVISEAVELAKRYSTEESGRFVNGVLASIAAETRPAELSPVDMGPAAPSPVDMGPMTPNPVDPGAAETESPEASRPA